MSHPSNLPLEPRQRIDPFDEQEPLPRGWELGFDADEQVYFVYTANAARTWQDPRFMPKNWEQRIDANGRLHFAYTPTQATTWTDPRAVPAGWSVALQSVAADAANGNAASLPVVVFTEAASGHGTTVDPRGLPHGFSAHVTDAAGKVFYRNHAAQSTQWEDPREGLSASVLTALRQNEYQQWFVAQIQTAYAQFMEENQFQEVENVQHTSLCNRLASAAVVKSKIKESAIRDLNEGVAALSKVEERVCGGCCSKETFELVFSFAFLTAELFQVVMACLLAILVPQTCTTNGASPRTCTTSELISPGPNVDQAAFSKVAVVINFVTLAVALVHYHTMWRREKALVHLAEADATVGADRLPQLLPLYPEVSNVLYLHHFRVFITSVLLAALFAINAVISAILVWRRGAGTTSVTVFLTNIGLLLRVLYKSIDQSHTGVTQREALSLFDYRPLSFNTIDADYVDPRDETKGGRVRVIKDGRELVLFDPNDETKKGGYDFRKLPFPVQYVQGIAQLKENKAAAAAAAQVGVHME